jgi:hypothetical protein
MSSMGFSTRFDKSHYALTHAYVDAGVVANILTGIHNVTVMLASGLPTAAARVRARVWSCGICGGQSGAGAGFLWVLRFSLPIFIPPIAPQSPSSIIWGLYNRREVAAVPSGLSPIPLKKIVFVVNRSYTLNGVQLSPQVNILRASVMIGVIEKK